MKKARDLTWGIGFRDCLKFRVGGLGFRFRGLDFVIKGFCLLALLSSLLQHTLTHSLALLRGSLLKHILALLRGRLLRHTLALLKSV